MTVLAVVASIALGLAACRPSPPPLTPDQVAIEVDRLADLYYERALGRSPEIAYFFGIAIDRHDGLSDNSPEAVARARAEDDQMLAELDGLDVALLKGRPQWATYGILREALEASRGVRVCRSELWNVDFMGGWQIAYPQIASLQPVGSPELREQALARWRRFPEFVDQERANLAMGIERGNSAPASVVRRVIDQLDGLLALPLEESPFMSPAGRDETPEFVEEVRRMVGDEILPAITRYRDYLAGSYLELARDELAVTAHPDGAACYQALLRYHTTLDRTPEEVFELGRMVVERNRFEVIRLGAARYGTEDFATIIDNAKEDPEDRFATSDEVLEFSVDAVRRSEQSLEQWFGLKPARACTVEPYPPYQDGTGVDARYEPGTPERPGTYRIPLSDPRSRSRGNLEITAFHEANPGHHLQLSIAQELQGVHDITKLVFNGGYVEGWARYAETLAEEMGLYRTETAPILRRAWPARGMVVDPGVHVMGWTRDRAKQFILESGRIPPEQGDQLVDRIANSPGQLTAYDSGALEIFALRREAEERLGTAFDIREFHDRVLESGSLPLPMLREHVASWLAEAP